MYAGDLTRLWCYLEKGVRVPEHPPDEGVPRLVVSHDPLLVRPEGIRLLFGAGNHPLDGVLEVVARYLQERDVECRWTKVGQNLGSGDWGSTLTISTKYLWQKMAMWVCL